MIQWIKNFLHRHVAIDTWKDEDGFSHGDGICYCGKRIRFEGMSWKEVTSGTK